MSMSSDKQQSKEDQHNTEQQRVARIKTALKFICAFALCLVLAPWLETIFKLIKA